MLNQLYKRESISLFERRLVTQKKTQEEGNSLKTLKNVGEPNPPKPQQTRNTKEGTRKIRKNSKK
jgi:hypothetical protein